MGKAALARMVSDGNGHTSTLGDYITAGIYRLEAYTERKRDGTQRTAYRAIRADGVFFEVSEVAYRTRAGQAVETTFARKRNERKDAAWRELMRGG